MSHTHRRTLLLALLLLFLGTAPLLAQFNGPADTARDTVNAPHPITIDPIILYPPARNVRIQVGDLLHVTLYGTDYTAQDRVSAEGTVAFPLLDPVQITDLTIQDAERLVSQRLADAGMFRNAQVRIDITESPRSVITVLGEAHGSVAAPAGSRRLFEVLAAIGGVPSTVSHVINIDRPGLPDSINVDLGSDPEQSKYANIPVFAGDTITTSRIGNVYLLGAFRNQGAFALNSNAPLTMMQLLSTGGGKIYEARLDKVHIVRTVGTQRTVVTVDVAAALKGQAPDPVLQTDDIIIVPTNQLKAAIKNGGLTTIFGLALTVFSLSRY